MEVPDRVWRNQTKNYVRPFPERVGVTPRGHSRRLERVLTDFGSEKAFGRAVASVWEHYGFEIGASAVRNVTLEQASRAREKLRGEYQESFRVLPAVGPTHVIAQVDGTMICTVEPGPRKGKRPRAWKEMRLAVAHAQGSETKFYGATFGSVEEIGRRWGHCARDAGWGLNSEIHAVGDGAEWIRLQTKEVFQAQGIFLCDFFHVGEYLGDAADTCRPDQPEAWRNTQGQRLRQGAVQKVIEALEAHLEPVGTAEEDSPVRNGHRYLTNRLDCLDYPRALRLDLPIGSGLIESGNRHVLQHRLKQAGTAWLVEHADQIAHLRVLRANKRWECLWN